MNAQPTADFNIHTIMRLLRRRTKMIVAIGLSGAALAALLGLVIPPHYTGKAQLVVSGGQATLTGQAALNGQMQAIDDGIIETHVAMLASDRHLQHILDSFHNEVTTPDQPAFRADPETFVQKLLNRFAPEPEDTAQKKDEASPAFSPSLAANLDRDVLARDLNVFRERRSRVIGVSFTSKDPHFAAEVANRTVLLYLEDQTLRERNWNEKELARIDERIPQLRLEAEKASATAQAYEIEHGITVDRKDNVNETSLAELSRQLSLARSDLAERQERLIHLRKLQRSDSSVPTMLQALNDPALDAMQEREAKRLRSRLSESASLSAQVPEQVVEVDQNMRIEIDRKLSQSEDEAQVLAARVQSLQQSVTTLQKASTDAREHEARLRELQLEAKLTTQLYENLLARQREMRENLDAQPNVRILSLSPVPNEPSSPNPVLFIIPALVFSLVPAGLLAVYLEKSDQSLRSEQDVKSALGIPCLGIVPCLPRRHRRQPLRYLLRMPPSPYAAGVRSVVASILRRSDPKSSPRIFLFTSSVTGEAKSTLAASFAVYAASLDRRVLLIATDAYVSPIFNLLGEKPDSSSRSAEIYCDNLDSIRPVPDFGIDYLPLSHGTQDPIALLSSGRVPVLLERLRENYDCIVVDGAPLLGTMETQMLAPLADKVILAVKWGETPRLVVQNALGSLRDAIDWGKVGNTSIGAVMTEVDLKRHARYGFGDAAEMLFRRGRSRPRTQRSPA